jgi:hypothetical protein
MDARREAIVRTIIALGTAIILAFAPTLAPAQKASKAPLVLAEADRQVSGGRVVQVALRQSEIEASIDIGRVANYNYGSGYAYDYRNPAWGFLFGDTDQDMHDMLYSNQRKASEALVAPLHKALEGFDVNALALAATSAGLAKPAWFQPRSVGFDPDRTTFLATSDAPQFALVWYRYELSPDFSQIRVAGEITLMRRRRAGDAGSDPLLPIYRQHILSIVQLHTRSYEPKENVALWSADGGKRAKAALTAAFAQFEALLPQALGLGQKDIDSLSDKRHEKGFAAGFYGGLIARGATDPDDILIWSGGLVHAQSLP